MPSGTPNVRGTNWRRQSSAKELEFRILHARHDYSSLKLKE